MDFLDLFSAFPVDMPGSTSRRRSLQENIAGSVGMGVFPILDFFIVLFGRLYQNPILAGVVLPGVFTLVSLILCRSLRVSTGWTIAVSLGCLALCVVASMAALLLGIFVSIFSTF